MEGEIIRKKIIEMSPARLPYREWLAGKVRLKMLFDKYGGVIKNGWFIPYKNDKKELS